MLTGVAKSSRSPNIRLTNENNELTGDSDKVASLFADSLEKIHVTHTGPEFCDTMKLEVERQVQDHIDEYRPCFVPTSETGDSDPLVDTVDVTE